MILSPGDSFGTYTILGPLGAGGMGEVYRARDERLKRDVALKVLAAEAAREPGRVERFEVEAQAASALNHPSIVVVYEIGRAATPDGTDLPYLAMECLEGEPLSARIPRGGLPIREFLALASDLTDGLARAHESGILHRDLKPSNLYVTREGRLKILDFGLAKLRRAQGDPSPASETDTLTSPGSLLGTVGYLSPEQLRGESATFASDQFSAGCVLYEMLAGRRAFPGSAPAEIASAILRDEPLPLDSVRPGLPAPLVWVVERCLAKLPRERYGSTVDLARDLRTLKEHSGEIPRSSPSSPRRIAPPRVARRGLLAAALVAAGAALAALAFLVRPPRPAPEFRRLTFRDGSVWKALFDPRSTSVLYSASWDGGAAGMWLAVPGSPGLDRRLDGGVQLPLGYAADGANVLVLAGVARPAIQASGELAWWPSPGGSLRPVLDGAGWSDAGRRTGVLVTSRDAGPERVLEARDRKGGAPRVLYRTPGGISWLRISPDERQVAFIHHPTRFDDAGEVVAVPLAGGAGRVLAGPFERAAGLDWNRRTGEVWFTSQSAQDRGGTLLAATPGGRTRVVFGNLEYFRLQSVAADGRRALFVMGENRGRMFLRRRGEPLRDLSWLGWSVAEDVSPDATQVLFHESAGPAGGSWVRPLAGDGAAVPVGGVDASRFSPDGRLVVGITRGESPPRVALVPVGPGEARAISAPGDWDSPVFTAGGDVLARRTANGASFVRLRADGRGEAPLGDAPCRWPAVDPSGRELVCVSEDRRALLARAVDGGAVRVLFRPEPPLRFSSGLRWDQGGRLVRVLTMDLRLLTIDAATGREVAREELERPAGAGWGHLLGAALSPDGLVVVYSLARETAALYLAEGLE